MERIHVITAKYTKAFVLPGDSPLTPQQRNESLCEYDIRRSRRRLQEKSSQSLITHVPTTTQLHAISDSTIPDSSSLDHFSEVVVGRDAGGPANALNTPFSEMCFSQLVSDSTQSYLDL